MRNLMLLAVKGDERCSVVGSNFGWQDVGLEEGPSDEERTPVFVVTCTNSPLWHGPEAPSNPAGT
jgi:hypothetical protein